MTALPPVSPGLTAVDIMLNASSLKLLHCRRRYNWTVVHGLRSKETAEALTFGKAVHRYTESLLTGSPPAVAMQAALAEYKGDGQHLLASACLAMPVGFINPHRDESGPYVEKQFFFYWKSVVYETTQFNIYLCGTIDAMTRYADGTVEIVDWKTSKKYKWDEVFTGYRLSVQMRFYLWVVYKFGHEIFPLDIANATRAGHVFLRIGAIFVSSKPPLWKMGSPLQLSSQELDLFGEQLDRYIRTDVIPAWLDDEPTGMLNDTCTRGEQPGRPCDFAGMCHAQNSAEYDQARAEFKLEKYDPRSF